MIKPSSTADGWALLTPAERSVVDMIRRGWSNEQVARARGGSKRTVAHQLTLAYRKLGVMSRRELRALLRSGAPLDRHSSSPRQSEVLALVQSGHSNKAIAYALGLSLSSVAAALKRARRKLEARGDDERAQPSRGLCVPPRTSKFP